MDSVLLKQSNEFLKKSYTKALIPCMLTILSANINVFVDGILVGNRIGVDALAAINLCLPLFLFMCVVGSFFASGTAILAAKEIGKNKMAEAQEYYSTCVICLFAMSVLFTGIGLLLRNSIAVFLCVEETIRPLVLEYIIITLIGALPKLMIYIPLWYLRLDGDNNAVLVMMGVSCIGNVVLDVLFVYFLNMGVFGAGLASVIAVAVAFMIGVVRLLRPQCNFKFRPMVICDIRKWKEIASAGTPSAFNNLASTIRIIMINYFLMDMGNGLLVAVFSAINGIYGVGEAIVLGVPQAASPMLGVYDGEMDYDSSVILLRLEVLIGFSYAFVFALLVLGLHTPIQRMYNLDEPLFLPLLWMVLSVFFALFGVILQTYYNVSSKNIWANGLILLRVLLMPFLGLLAVKYLHFSTFSFWLFGEAGAIFVWFIAVSLRYKSNGKESKYFFMNTSLKKSGRVINFTVFDDVESICDSSEKISGFCSSNGFSSKNTMKLQLSIEELLTLISTMNKEEMRKEKLYYDLRAYSVQGVNGIRIRYNGILFNPFDEKYEDDDRFMGIKMIMKLVETYDFTRTFGMNTLIILLKEAS